MSENLDMMIAARRRAQSVARMRSLARGGLPPRVSDSAAPSAERCDICHAPVPDDHRHMLHLVDRCIVCTCEACWALHSGDAEYRPTGMRILWLEEFACPDEIWGAFAIPIGLAFFMRSTVTGSVVAFYPSPAGATESELSLEAWDALVALNPMLAELEADAEALVVNRISIPPQHAVVPIDQCYALVGLIKSRWEGISGGSALEQAVPEFFAALRERAVVTGGEALR
ncbi:MAG TPA: DUF5947 family protein [Solirubrobacteraceae bacterium]